MNEAKKNAGGAGSGFARIEIMMGMKKLTPLLKKLSTAGITGITGVTVFQALGCGIQHGSYEYTPEETTDIQLLPKTCLLIICEQEAVADLVELLKLELYTGHIGDGKIFISGIDNIIRIRTGEEGGEVLRRSDIG